MKNNTELKNIEINNWNDTELTTPIEKESITDNLLADEMLAENLNDIALNATKTVSSKEDWFMTVPDYTSRLKALDMEFRMKWHFKEKDLWNQLPKWIYVFKKT